jgi:uncharacterized protein
MPAHFSSLIEGNPCPLAVNRSGKTSPSIILDRSRPQKTLDFGCDGLVCSIGFFGDIIALSTYHPQHGIVVVNPFEQFPGGDKFWDSSFVREYRKKFIDTFDRPGSGFGIQVKGLKENIKTELLDGRWPNITYQSQSLTVKATYFVAACPSPVLVNRLSFWNATLKPRRAEVDFGGQVSINRASYGQLTEAGPVPIPSSLNQSRYEEGSLFIQNPNLPATMACGLYLDGDRVLLNGRGEDSFGPLSVKHNFSVDIPPHQSREIVLHVSLSPTFATFQISPVVRSFLRRDLPVSSGFRFNDTKSSISLDRFVIRRTLDYLLSCCCFQVDQHAICVVTDHLALPLGWHRDN